MTKKHIIITIDGPAASGKSTIAQELAKKLDYYYLYTGLLYRAVAYVAGQIQHATTVPENLNSPSLESFGGMNFIGDMTYEYCQGYPHIFYQGKDITAFLQDSALAQQASIVSADIRVREALLSVQRTVAQHYDIIADGRDCGTVVFPNADVKFFLTADVSTRAQRIFSDQKRKAGTMTLDQIKAGLQERDNRDQSRAVAPLVIPDGAIVIDNSAMSLQQTVDEFLRVIGQKLQENE